MEIITASSLADLREKLEAVPDIVPPRGLGRLTEHTEPWVMKRLVASLATSEFLRFPVTIELSDRPDIVIHSDGRDIGVELMRKQKGQVLKLDKLYERCYIESS